ncbi:MAG: (d)CMP kinase, partial [Lentisphaerae bacterium]|nr:(d)CMP kinase [Lentisphaerota bacterium]
TGDMYRALAWAARQNGIDPEKNPEALTALLPGWELRYRLLDDRTLQLFFNGQPIYQDKLRAPEVTAIVSQVARIPEVREWMLERQRECSSLGVIIMEGRDIGTVILPQAKFKFFITASPMERARRRLAQSGEVAADATLAKVAAEIEARDHIDSTRETAPLKPAPDAITLVTDGMNQEQVANHLAEIIKKSLT